MRSAKVADAQGRVTVAQVALAWLLSAQGPHVVPIPGVKRMATMRDSAWRQPELELSQSDIDELSAAVPPGFAQGGRYPEQGMRMVRL